MFVVFSKMLRLGKLLSLTILLVGAGAERLENGTLVKTIIIFRHGMRAPLKNFQLQETPDDASKYWPHGFGNLVHNGKLQMFHFGQKLYQHFKDLVEPFSTDVTQDLQAVATPVYRCYESAVHLLAGFFSLSNDWTWSEAIEKQPVPILNISPDRAVIIGKKDACPKYNELLEENLPDFSRPDLRFMRDYIMDHSSRVNVTSLNDLFMAIDYMKIMVFMNLDLPKWITKDFFKQLNHFFVESFDYLTMTQDMLRLMSGPLIEDITNRIKDVIHAKPTNTKMFLYAGHDASLWALSQLLGVKLNFVPHFGSSIIFEVYKVSVTDYRVRMLFSADYSFDNVKIRELPKCQEFCPVGRFLQIVEKFFVSDWDAECLSV